MDWTKILPYGPDAYAYWISGIYKIVSYEEGEYHAFFLQDHHKNWGDYVTPPTDYGKHGKCWLSFVDAAKACELHAKLYRAAEETVTRAGAILLELIAQSKRYSLSRAA